MKHKLVVALLIFAAALRILGAGSSPVWTDEGWSIWASSDPTQVIGIVAADRHPPLYFAALSIWRIAAGDSHIALRYLSILGGMLLVALVYRLAVDVFGRRTGLYALILIAALPIAIYYAQEVRHYGWLALFSTLAWLIFLRYLKRPSWGLWIGYVLSITALMYTLYFGAFTIGIQGIIALIAFFRRGRARPAPTNPTVGLFAAWIVAAILYIPWATVIVTQQAGILGSGISGFPGTFTPESVLPILQSVFSAQIVIPFAAFLIGVLAILRRPTIQRISVLLGGGGLFVLMFALSVKFDFLAARTLVFVTPLLMIACGYGLSQMDAWLIDRWGFKPPATEISSDPLKGSPEPRLSRPFSGRRTLLAEGLIPRRRILGGLILIIWLLPTLTLPQTIQPRLDSGTAAHALATAYQPGDAVILEAGWDDNAFAYEISQALPRGAEIIRTLPWTNDRTGGAPVVPQIEPILQSHTRVWVVQWLQAPQVLPYLQGGGDGFHADQTLDVSAGDYGARFYAPTIQIRSFTK